MRRRSADAPRLAGGTAGADWKDVQRHGWRVLATVGAAVFLLLWFSNVSKAASGSLTYIKDGNVFVTPAEGGAASKVTGDATPTDPYLAAPQSASGMIVALRHDTAFRLAQSGRPVAAPLSLGFGASGGGSVSADGATLAYEAVELCGISLHPCISTAFTSLTSGKRLVGKGLQMINPTWVDGSVVGAVDGGVSITGPDRPAQYDWFSYTDSTFPAVGVGTDSVKSVAASRGGTRLAVTTSSDRQGSRVLWLLTASGLGASVTPVCWMELPPGPDAHVVWSPDGSAIAWEDADGVWTQSVVDLSGTDAGCQANADTGKLIAPGGTRPDWSPAPYDPNSVVADTRHVKPPVDNRRVSFRLASPTKLTRALHRGLELVITCPQACTATASARIDSRTSRRFMLGRGPTIIGRAPGHKIRAGKSTTARLRFTRRAQRQLRKAASVKMIVTVTYRYSSGSTTRSRKLTVRR